MKDFLFTLLAWLLTLPIIVAAVAFAIYNGADVSLTINPFREAVSVPLYIPVLSAVGFGFLFGALMTWAAMGRIRKERRADKKKIRALEERLSHTTVTDMPAPRKHNYALIPSRLIGKRYP